MQILKAMFSKLSFLPFFSVSKEQLLYDAIKENDLTTVKDLIAKHKHLVHAMIDNEER